MAGGGIHGGPQQAAAAVVVGSERHLVAAGWAIWRGARPGLGGVEHGEGEARGVRVEVEALLHALLPALAGCGPSGATADGVPWPQLAGRHLGCLALLAWHGRTPMVDVLDCAQHKGCAARSKRGGLACVRWGVHGSMEKIGFRIVRCGVAINLCYRWYLTTTAPVTSKDLQHIVSHTLPARWTIAATELFVTCSSLSTARCAPRSSLLLCNNRTFRSAAYTWKQC
eukprot:69514-Prorocentrum_minimum.AAC.1